MSLEAKMYVHEQAIIDHLRLQVITWKQSSLAEVITPWYEWMQTSWSETGSIG